jgi:uncharacterized membrane protein YvlD (DUF360 family)
MIGVSLLVDFVLTAILLKLVSSVLPDLEIDGLGSAFIAALIASVAGVAVQFVAFPLLAKYLPVEGWIATAVSHALSIVTLAIGIAFAPGIKGGALSILMAAVLVSAASYGLWYVILPLIA